MNSLKKKYYIIYIFLGYFAVSMIIQKSFVTEFPRHIHAWAHCDHYAISKGFVNNGFDFFHAETFVYNKQFPNADGSSVNTKITAVDFPINNYVVAILMKIFNTDAPAIFRLYTLIVACIGLSFLFLISLHFTKNWIISFCIPVISAFTPIYLDYQVGFLPSITSLTLLFLSCYYFLKYVTLKNLKYLIYVVIGISFAALIRTPFVIHLIALLGFIFFDQIIKKKINSKEWLIIVSGFILPAIYFLYNGYLRDQYGSIFLSSPLIVENWEQAKEILKRSHEIWKDHYFNEFQYILIYFSIVALFLKLLLSKFHLSKEGKSLVIWFSIGSIGVLSYSILMLPQFRDHDYYFLDTFYPVIFILSVYIFSSIKYQSYSDRLSSIGLVILSVIIISSSNSTLNGRRSLNANDIYLKEYNAYLELDSLLIENDIPKTERLLIIDAYAPNMPFILSNTSGYAMLYRSEGHILNAFEMDFNYIVVSKGYFFNNLILDFKNFHQEVKLVDKSDKLLLFKKHKNNSELDLTNYIDVSKPLTTFSPTLNNCADMYADENGISNLTGKKYGLTFQKELSNNQSAYMVHVTGEVKCSEQSSAVFIFDVNDNGDNTFYNSTNLSRFVSDSSSFSKINFFVFVNDIQENSKGSFYIYNPDLQNLHLKNIKIELF